MIKYRVTWDNFCSPFLFFLFCTRHYKFECTYVICLFPPPAEFIFAAAALSPYLSLSHVLFGSSLLTQNHAPFRHHSWKVIWRDWGENGRPSKYSLYKCCCLFFHLHFKCVFVVVSLFRRYISRMLLCPSFPFLLFKRQHLCITFSYAAHTHTASNE